MINYTKDKGGCLIFTKETDLAQLNLNNCFVVKGDKSFWVFPFGVLEKYVSFMEVDSRGYSTNKNLDDFVENKECYFIMSGQKKDKSFHFACRNKQNYITGNCKAWRCNYMPLPNLTFRWNKAKTRKVKSMYCDIQGRGRKIIPFTELCPSKAIMDKNKSNLSLRGKKAGLTRSIKEKCGECLYSKVCSDKFNHIQENCRVSRKMFNRRMRELADRRFGSFQHLVEMMSYVTTTQRNDEVSIICPYSKDIIITKEKEPNGIYNRTRIFKKRKFSEIKKDFIPINQIDTHLEEQAKIFMFLLSILKDNESDILCNPIDKSSAWQLYHIQEGSGYGGGYNKYQYQDDFLDNFNNYEELLKIIKKRNKERIFG